MKPHFGHLYGRPNFLHFPQRFIWISPQLGQRNFVASAPGGIGLPQLVHVTKVNVAALSAMTAILGSGSVIVRLPYILYVSGFATLLFQFLANIEKGVVFWA
jgi:hypothetical protein